MGGWNEFEEKEVLYQNVFLQNGIWRQTHACTKNNVHYGELNNGYLM